MREIANLKRVADEFRGEDTGTLSIATTHTQARYVLPKVLARIRDALSEGQGRAAPGQSDAGRRANGARRSRSRHRDRGARRFSRARHAALLRVEPRRDHAQAPSAREDEAADARGARQVPDRHLRLQLHRTLRDQRRVRREGTRAQRRADRARLRRHQDVRRTRHGRRHHRADGLRPRARHRSSRSSTPITCSRRRRPASDCATACSCAATCTRSSRCSRRSTTARPSMPRSRAASRR